jgi:two-component system sensor histidine kinase PhoQ
MKRASWNPVTSIRARLVLGATLVLVAFLAAAGYAVQRAHREGVEAAHFARLQSTTYLLLAGAELNPQGELVMPVSFPEPRLSLPSSGLYARILNTRLGTEWRSASVTGLDPPFQQGADVGQWKFGVVEGGGASYMAVTYAVRWRVDRIETPLVLSVLEDRAPLVREERAFVRTLWSWLGGAAVFLLLSQTLLLEWGLSPLGRVAGEIRRVENGEQPEVAGRYPVEIAALTDNINTLVRQERLRQTRYREALSYLAHSLKTPLAVLRNAPEDPALVEQQVARMDDIVQHQLARAKSGTGALFASPLALGTVASRVRESLGKVYADKGLRIDVDIPADLTWRIEVGEAFELLGNLMDNAAKWSRSKVSVRAAREGRDLRLLIDDDGPGFSDTESVLQLHVRGDEQVPGHGVGLAVVDDIVAAQNGTLQLGRSPLGGARVDILLRAP